MMLEKLRSEVIKYALRMYEEDLVPANWGNVSARDPETNLFAITPTNTDYDQLKPGDISIINLEGKVIEGDMKPSSEVPFHCCIYQTYKKYHGIIHTHSIYATAMGVLGRSVPVVVPNLVSAAGGEIPVVRYIRGGTWELGKAIVEGLGDLGGVLLANHGVVTVGPSLKRAFEAATVIEDAAHIYLVALGAGEPAVLSDEEVGEIQRRAFRPKYLQD